MPGSSDGCPLPDLHQEDGPGLPLETPRPVPLPPLSPAGGTGRGPGVGDFEDFVYGNFEALETLFTRGAVQELLEADYSVVLPGSSRCAVRDAIAVLPADCECLEIPPTVEMDIGFLGQIEDSVALLEYVDQRVLNTLSLCRTVEELSGLWECRRPGSFGPQVFLQEGRLYACTCCGTHWLVLLDESTVAYLFLELSSEEIEGASAQDLEKKLGDLLGYRRCP